MVAGQAGRPIPALPPSLFVPHHKENAKSGRRRARIAVRTKKSLGFPPSSPSSPSPLITMIGVHFPCNKMQQNASGEVVTQRRDSTNVSVFLSGGLASSWWECEKIQLSQVSLLHKEGLLLTLAARRTDRNTSDDTHWQSLTPTGNQRHPLTTKDNQRPPLATKDTHW